MEPNWIEKSALLAIHGRLIAEFGGSCGVRDLGLLESALARPKNLYEYDTPSLAELAASYAVGISKNHPFIDGNKRVALVACELFLRLNDQKIKATQLMKYDVFMKLASGDLTENQLVEWLNTCIG